MSFLRLDNLTKRFGDFTAVEGMSLDVEKGEFVSLLGPSGCGKTTTLQMIAGLHEPSDGRIFLDGEDITRKKPNRRGLGIVFQSYALFPHMTVFDNVSFGLEMRGVEATERKERVTTALTQVKLGPFAQRYPKELSGGQRQRVALARALVIEPPVLLLDEPLSNLDAKLREEMQLELRLLQQNLGVTTILVTHDQSEALSMSDRIVVMNGGRAVQVDTPVGMYETPADAFVSDFVGKTNLLEGVVESADGAGATVKVSGVDIETRTDGLAPGQTVWVSLRPEKLLVSSQQREGGVPGTLSTCIFHGDRWLYQVSTQLGELIVTEPNTGHDTYHRGDAVCLTWSEAAVRVLPKENAA
jgi:putative spermidine/putrescine transport system ATP-binding protein